MNMGDFHFQRSYARPNKAHSIIAHFIWVISPKASEVEPINRLGSTKLWNQTQHKGRFFGDLTIYRIEKAAEPDENSHSLHHIQTTELKNGKTRQLKCPHFESMTINRSYGEKFWFKDGKLFHNSNIIWKWYRLLLSEIIKFWKNKWWVNLSLFFVLVKQKTVRPSVYLNTEMSNAWI